MLPAPQLVLAITLSVLLAVGNVLLFARLLDPSEFSRTPFLKFSAFVGLSLVQAAVFLLHFDIAAPAAAAAAWEALLIALFVHDVVVAPLQLFYAEADDDEGEQRRCFSAGACGSAVLQSCAAWALVALALGVGYKYMATVLLPIRTFVLPASALIPAAPALLVAPATCAAAARAAGTLCPAPGSGAASELEVGVTFVVFLGAAFTWCGWLLFAAWAGVGFVALPITFIQAFLFRPRPLTALRAAAARRQLNARVSELLRLGESMEVALGAALGATRTRREASAVLKRHKTDVARLRLLVQAAETDVEAWQMADPAAWARAYNPLYPFLSLLCGILAAAFSCAWILHITIFMLPRPPAHPFLNSLLRSLAPLPMASTITLALMSAYLIAAVLAGLGKLGTRVLLLAIHPLEAGKTLSNALLFNVAALELCALPCVQLLCSAFPFYVASSAADALLGGAFENLSWFRYFYRYNVYLIAILFFSLCGAVWALLCPTQKAELARATQMLAARNARERQLLERKIEQRGGALEGLEMTLRAS